MGKKTARRGGEVKRYTQKNGSSGARTETGRPHAGAQELTNGASGEPGAPAGVALVGPTSGAHGLDSHKGALPSGVVADDDQARGRANRRGQEGRCLNLKACSRAGQGVRALGIWMGERVKVGAVVAGNFQKWGESVECGAVPQRQKRPPPHLDAVTTRHLHHATCTERHHREATLKGFPVLKFQDNTKCSRLGLSLRWQKR